MYSLHASLPYLCSMSKSITEKSIQYYYGHILLAKGMIIGFSEATCTL